MNNISINPSFLAIIKEMASVVQFPCILLIHTLMAVTLIITLARGFTARGGVSVDYGVVVRSFILLGLLYFYQELMELISGTIGAFAGYLNQPTNIYAALEDLPGGEASVTDRSLTDYVEEAVDYINSFNLLSLLQSVALGGIASIARKLMELVRQTLLGLLYVTGPIAISLSVLPFFGQLVQKWFQNYLAVQCWSITLIILDNIVVLYRHLSQHRLGLMHGLSVSEAAEKLDMILITLVIAMLYFMVPYITSLFIGQAQSALYPSRVLATGAGAAVLTAQGAAVLGGVTSMASGAASTISETWKDRFSREEDSSSPGAEPPSASRGGTGQSIPVRQ
ncbi:hypothetical protein [Cesiribacter sp. SM1]|uniref:hypothetical protein n=1 Tax=Cesiribacter sp. SM1 TaxID=2861196 RepID=UPI001CD35FAD|nr:hypothetical protein [Cesiribacter sp. SM1]